MGRGARGDRPRPRPSFPGDLRGQRGVIAISVLLVVLAIAMAIVTELDQAPRGRGCVPACGRPGTRVLDAVARHRTDPRERK